MALPSDQAREFVNRVRVHCSPDSELLHQFVQRRDSDTFRALIERHGNMVLNLCRRIIGDTHLAEDAFQATFLVLARRAETIAQPELLSNWLYGTARHISDKVRKKLPSPVIDKPNEIHSSERDPLTEISAREMLQIIEEELARLPDTYRIPLILCTLEGLTVNDAADHLNTTPGSIRGRLERGREKLSQQLSRRGITLPTALTTLLAVPRITIGENLLEAIQSFTSESVSVSSHIASLAVITPSGVSKIKFFFLGLFVVSSLGLGTAMMFQEAEPKKPLAEKKEPISKARLDHYGDPLPEGVVTRFGTIRMRDCGEPIRFSSDGKFIACAVGPSRSDVAIWDRQTGKELNRLKGEATLENIILSPSGKRIALKGNLDILIFDVESGKELFRFRGSDAAFTSDEKMVVTIGDVGSTARIQIFNADTGKKIKEIDNTIGRSSLVRMNPKGQIVVLDRTERGFETSLQVRLFDLHKGEEILSPIAKPKIESFQSMFKQYFDVGDDGNRLVISSGEEVSIWAIDSDKATLRKKWTKRTDSGAVISPDGKWMTWSGYDGIAHVWIASLDKGEPRRLGLNTNNFSTPAFSPDSKQVAYIDSGRALVIRDIETGKEVNRFDAHTGAAKINEITADGKYIISSDWNRILVWDRYTGQLLHRLPEELPSEETPFVNLIQAGHIVTRSNDNTIRLRDLITLKEVARLEKKDGFIGHPAEITFSEEGKSVAIRGQNYDFRIFDLPSGKLRINHNPYVALSGIRLSPEGRYFVAYQSLAPKEGYLPYVFDTQIKKEIKTKELPVPLPYSLLTPDYKKLVFGKELESWVKERNLLDENGKPIAENWNKVLNHFQISPNGRFIAITRYLAPAGEKNREGAVRLQVWDTQTSQRLRHLPFSPPFMTSLGFSPDSRFLLDTDREGVTRIQEIASGVIRFQIQGHLSNDASSLVFTPDYRGLLSGAADTQILLWDFTLRSPDGVWQTVRHSPEQQKELWNRVGGEDTKEAHQAIWELIADPSGTVKFLSEKLHPIEKPDEEPIAKLIERIDSDLFVIREKASDNLIKLADLALPRIREAIKKPASAEHKQRLEKLLVILENPILSGKKLQAVRGIEILERINTQEAKELMEKLGKGAPESFLTQEARFAYERMKSIKN